MIEKTEKLKDKDSGGDRPVDFVVRVYRRFVCDDCFVKAAAIAYFGVFSLSPLLLFTVAVAAYILPTPSVQAQVEGLVYLYAPGSADFISRNLSSLIRNRSQLGALAIVGLAWVSSAVFTVITRSLNQVWDVEEDTSFWRTTLIGVLVVLALGFLLLLSVSISTVSEFIGAYESDLLIEWGLRPVRETPLWQVVEHLIPMVLTFLVFMVIYRFFPAKKLRLTTVLPGSVFATASFEGAKILFVNYLKRVSHYELLHGSLTTMVLLLMWIYIGAIILLLGAELNVELARNNENK